MTILSSQISAIRNSVSGDDPEKFVRESYTWRHMEAWEVYSLTAISGALLLAVVIYALV